MEFCMNEPDQQVFSSTPASYGPLDDLFPPQNTEVDMSLEWLSVFVEDCLTSPGNCLPAATMATPATTTISHVSQTSATPNPPNPKSVKSATNCSGKLFVFPGKARSKRKRVVSARVANPVTSWSYGYGHNQPFYFTSSDPALLDQAHWLADSELIMPKTEVTSTKNSTQTIEEQAAISEEKSCRTMEEVIEKKNQDNKENEQQLQTLRRCTHCQSQRTPQWRAGPLGPKTLCNACGVRFKSGRLLPEYRPAKSPTFVSFLHSNSHKKVLEMRNMASTSN